MKRDSENLLYVSGNTITVFTEGDDLYDAMCADIAAAKHSVWLESYILSNDAIGHRFIELLQDCRGRGVDVRVRVDAFGSRLGFSGGLGKQLRQSEIKFERCLPWQWLKPWLFHRRNHRKLLVVDNAVAYLGGFNISALNSRRLSSNARWRDTHLRLVGPIAGEAAKAFLSIHYDELDCLCDEKTQALTLLSNYGRRCGHQLRCLLVAQLARAKERIWLATPYFVPDGRMQRELCRAAERGVDVRVLVTAKTDAPIVQWAARASYSNLLAAGVHIYEYQPRMLHAKTLVVDTDWCTVGTANLDYRSLFINYELNLAANSTELNDRLASNYLNDLKDAEEIFQKIWSRRPLLSKAVEWIGWGARHWL